MPIRKSSRWFSGQALRNLLYLPVVVANVRNWPVYFSDYARFNATPRTYVLRNGTRIRTQGFMDTATIGVIFFRREYGKVADNSIVIDGGANTGIFSLYAASTARNTRVYAYEPVAENFEKLVENIRQNRFEDRIVPFRLALSGKREKRRLYLSGANTGHSLYTEASGKRFIEIDCVTLEDIFHQNNLTRCDLLKLDCEGAEYETLYNTSSDILSRVCNLRLEYHGGMNGLRQENHNVQDLMNYLKSMGFRTVKFEPAEDDRGLLWMER